MLHKNIEKDKNAPKIKRFFCFIFVVLSINQSFYAHAMNSVELRQLKELDPQTRLEQRCDIEAITQLNKTKKWSADKVLAYAFSDPIVSTHHIKAKGAAFRSRGKWYHLSYDCKAQPDHITITSFKFTTGELIPISDWDKHYLVP